MKKTVNTDIKIMDERIEVTIKKTGKCSLCGNAYTNYGHNPEPLKRYEQRCCDDCNMTKVVPARIHDYVIGIRRKK